MTTPDNPAYENRPSHWNEAHSVNLLGSEVVGAFSNAGNVSFAVETNGRITASANVTAAASPVNISAGTTSGNLQTVVFSNSNGVSFGLNGSTITASHNGLTTAALSNHSHGDPTLALTNLSGTTASNSAGLTLSLSAAAQSVQPVAASGANGSFAFSTLSFSNANGISFGTSAGSAITASHNALTTARASNDAIGLNTAQSNVTWTVNSSGLSLDARGYAGTVTAVTGNASLTVNSAGVSFNGSNLAGVGTSVTGGAAVTLNSNGLQFNGASLAGTSSGFTGANISASITHNTAGLALSMSVAAPGGGGNFSAGLSNVGNTSGDTGVTGTRLVFAGGNNITLSQATDANGATVTVSGANAGGAQTGISGVIVSNTTYTSGTISFSNANGISFGSSAGQAITASYTVPSTAGLISAVNVSAGTTSNNLSALTFANGNGISFGLNASTITASYTVPTQTNQTIGGYFVGNTTGQSSSSTVDARSISFDGAGIVSAGWSNGTVRISATQSNQAASAANGSFAFQTVNFSNANGVSFVTSAGSAIAASVETSYAASNHSHGNPTLNLTNLSGTTASNSAGFTLSLSAAAGGGVNPAASASNGSFNFTTLNFSNANNVTFGTSAGGIITASVAAPGAAAENNNINLLGANTAGNTTASGSTIGWSGINVTLSGTNGSIVNISAPATSSIVGVAGISISTNGSTISISNSRGWVSNYENRPRNVNNSSFSSFGQNTVYLQHFIPEQEVRFSSLEWWARGSFVSSTNSQVYAQTIRYGFYSQDGTGASSTRMTRVGSSSNVIQVSYNSNTAAGFTVNDGATSYTTTSGGTALLANISGAFHHYMPFSSTLEPNVKWALGIAISSATTVGTSPFRYAPYIHTVQNSLSHARIFNTGTSATATTVVGDREMAVYSATSGALPSSYATSQISIAVSRQQLPFMLEV